MLNTPRPLARLTALLAAIVGTLIARSLAVLVGGFAMLLLLSICAGLQRTYGRFLIVIVAPLGAALVIVWGYLVQAEPGAALGSDPHGGLMFAALTTTRLAIIGGITQLGLLSISSDRLASFLIDLRVKSDLFVIIVGSTTLVPELEKRAEQMLVAKKARGLSHGFASTVLQLPTLLRSLVGWIVRAAIARAETWQQRGLLDKLATGSEALPYSNSASLVWLATAGVWVVVSVLTIW